MIHWLEQSLLTSAAFSAGAVWQWWTQRGTCRSCRIRYSIRRALRPLADRMASKLPPGTKALTNSLIRTLEVALAFAFWDTMKLGWYLVAIPYFQQFRKEHHGRKEKAPVS